MERDDLSTSSAVSSGRVRRNREESERRQEWRRTAAHNLVVDVQAHRHALGKNIGRGGQACPYTDRLIASKVLEALRFHERTAQWFQPKFAKHLTPVLANEQRTKESQTHTHTHTKKKTYTSIKECVNEDFLCFSLCHVELASAAQEHVKLFHPIFELVLDFAIGQRLVVSDLFQGK
jgi:hypothetical protein